MPEPRAPVHRQRGDVLVVDQHLARIGGDQPGDDVEAGGLAGAVRPQQAHGLAAMDVERDVAQHRAAAIVLGQMAGGTGPRGPAGPSPGVAAGGVAPASPRPPARARQRIHGWGGAGSGTNRARTRWLDRAAGSLGLVDRHDRHARVAVDVQAVAAHHVLVAGEDDVAQQHHLAADQVVDPAGAGRGLARLGDHDVALGLETPHRLLRAGGLAFLVAGVEDPQQIGAQGRIALDRVDIAGEDGLLLVLLQHQTVRSDLDRLVATAAGCRSALRLLRRSRRPPSRTDTDSDAIARCASGTIDLRSRDPRLEAVVQVQGADRPVARRPRTARSPGAAARSWRPRPRPPAPAARSCAGRGS